MLILPALPRLMVDVDLPPPETDDAPLPTLLSGMEEKRGA